MSQVRITIAGQEFTLDRSRVARQLGRVLRRLGFIVRRCSREDARVALDRARGGPHGGREADLLRPYAGQWVAQRGTEVLVAADTPAAVLGWLERHGEQADAMSAFQQTRPRRWAWRLHDGPVQGASRQGGPGRTCPTKP